MLGLLGLIAVFVADFFANQISLQQAARRPGDAVRDVEAIIDASIRWSEINPMDQWPNNAVDINIETLFTDGFLDPLPGNRYNDCPGGCGEYRIVGWDRFDPPMPDGTLGEYTLDPLFADDLIVRFNVAGGGDAFAIASRLPLGRVTGEIDPDVFELETRVSLVGGFSERFVRLRNENRRIEFAEVSHPTGDPRPNRAGELFQVGFIGRQSLSDADPYAVGIALGAGGQITIASGSGSDVIIDNVRVADCIGQLAAGAALPIPVCP